MPQMSPMSWVIMMTLFISVYIIFNTTNFFTLSYPQQSKTRKW